ncbi:hypothetical protein SFMTTN_1414 [Sulfuriferula multivorans]|uniref:Uncharacterized protein n=1 Tax=Sulfuriferula multivorans TaxID=1559896 RepID=A0A401JDD8_9PROT|nr:hypothetical protein SFMTTN_1414 [Sulfuriferula multivorans]
MLDEPPLIVRILVLAGNMDAFLSVVRFEPDVLATTASVALE